MLVVSDACSTNRIEDAEDFSTVVEDPSLRVSLKNCSNYDELNKTKETGVGCDGEPGGVLLENRGLQDEPGGPRQAMADQVYAAQSPALSFCISKH